MVGVLRSAGFKPGERGAMLPVLFAWASGQRECSSGSLLFFVFLVAGRRGCCFVVIIPAPPRPWTTLRSPFLRASLAAIFIYFLGKRVFICCV